MMKMFKVLVLVSLSGLAAACATNECNCHERPASKAARTYPGFQGQASWYPSGTKELEALYKNSSAGARLRVTNKENNKSVIVTVISPSPASGDISLSQAAAENIGLNAGGLNPVAVEELTPAVGAYVSPPKPDYGAAKEQEALAAIQGMSLAVFPIVVNNNALKKEAADLQPFYMDYVRKAMQDASVYTAESAPENPGMPPLPSSVNGAVFVFTSELFRGAGDGAYRFQIWLYDMKALRLICTDEMVYRGDAEAKDFLPPLTAYLLSQIPG